MVRHGRFELNFCYLQFCSTNKMGTAYRFIRGRLNWFYYKALQKIWITAFMLAFEIWMELTPTQRQKCYMLTCSLENSGFTDSILCCSCTCIAQSKWIMLGIYPSSFILSGWEVFFVILDVSTQSTLSQVSNSQHMPFAGALWPCNTEYLGFCFWLNVHTSYSSYCHIVLVLFFSNYVGELLVISLREKKQG